MKKILLAVATVCLAGILLLTVGPSWFQPAWLRYSIKVTCDGIHASAREVGSGNVIDPITRKPYIDTTNPNRETFGSICKWLTR